MSLVGGSAPDRQRARGLLRLHDAWAHLQHGPAPGQSPRGKGDGQAGRARLGPGAPPDARGALRLREDLPRGLHAGHAPVSTIAICNTQNN